MDKRKEANLRVKANITNALFCLLKQKSISQITVSEIIRSAGVARASFYRNYATKESVLTTLISDILESYRTQISLVGGAFYTYENVRLSFAYFERYGEQMLDLHRFGYGSIVLEKLNRFHEEIAGTMPCSAIERYTLYMYTGSFYNTAMVWLQSGMKESAEEIAGLFYRACAIPFGSPDSIAEA